MTNGGGKLFLQVLLPSEYTVNKVGGTNHRYYVEDDGDDSDGYDGTNHDGYSETSWHDYGNWRIEISPKAAASFDTFLNVLRPRHSSTSSVESAEVLLDGPMATVMRVGERVVGFGTGGQIDQDLTYALGGGTRRHLIVDLDPGGFYKITGETGYELAYANGAGVLSFTETAPGAHEITLAWVLDDPPPGDATRDGIVDGGDYTVWADNYNPGGLAVPEPAALALLICGGMAFLRRRR